MYRTAFGLVGLLLVGAFAGLALSPAAAGVTEIPIDITKEIHGYTMRIVGMIVIDETARTVSGELHITVTDPNGDVVYERDITFSFSWSTPPSPATFYIPGSDVRVTVTFGGPGIGISAVESPRRQMPEAALLARLSRVE